MQRAIERVAHVGQIVEPADQAADQRRLEFLEHHPDARDRGDRLAQRHEVARPGRAERRARDQPFDVVDALERVAQLGARRAAEREVLDRVEPVLDPLERDERPQQPAAQQAAAHRRDGAIDLMQQRVRCGRRRPPRSLRGC